MITREEGKEYILSLSYGKDSLACLEAIRQLDYPLDKCIHAEVWATDELSADLPEMVEFKQKADEIIKSRYGITVERVHSQYPNGDKRTFESCFYSVKEKAKTHKGEIYGWPYMLSAWCLSWLKIDCNKSTPNTTMYLGIASDEPKRIAKHIPKGFILPLVDIGWDEPYCYDWCKENDLLSPIYSDQMRGGCWFCPKQPLPSLRLIYKSYPEYWNMMLKWDKDSPNTFKPDGQTLHDFDKRFRAEDLKLVPTDRKFRWKMLEGLKIDGFSTNS